MDATPRRRWKLPRTALLLAAATVAAGATSASLLKPEPPAAEPASEHKAEAVPPPLPVSADPAALDALIRAGHFADALARCKSHPGGAYREGLCLEALGRWAEAADAHRRAADPDGDAGSWARATLGQARCAASAGDLPAARQLLAGVARRFGQPDGDAPGVFEECLHLRARLEVLSLGPPRPTDPLDADALAWPALTADASRYPDWLPADGPPGSPMKGGDEPPATDPDLPPAKAVAAAALRRVLADAPNHPAANAVKVTLANLEFEAGRLREAAAAYREVADDPNAADAVYAAHNLGLLELRRFNLPAARARFLEVVDRGWPAAGWWWAGRTHLDAGDTAAARSAFRTALAAKAKPGKDVTSAAALGVAACDLFDGDDAAARTALRHHRPWGDAHLAVADWFDGLLRHRLAPSPGRCGEVVAAVCAADDGRRLGPVGVLLAGAAYRELGLPDRMAAVYDAGAEACRGPVAARMTFEAAQRYEELDLRPAARQRYLAVAATDPRGYGPRAGLRAAELAARDGRGAECVVRCRGLVGNPGVGQDEVLAVMGRGYELARDYRRAAECFAGRVPAE
jgi:tetratricopeptide (TPR) repeat protein